MDFDQQLTTLIICIHIASCRSWSNALHSLSNGYIMNLQLDGLHDATERLQLIADHHPKVSSSIQRISFEFCNQLQNFDLVPLGNFPQLTHLNLNACRNLTDSAIEIVVEKCQKLVRLDLYWCVVLTDISINALATSTFAPLLTHLNLSGLKHITDESLAPLLRRCTSLTFLDLTRCEAMRDESLKAIGESCHSLRTLLLYATPRCTDVGFTALAPGIPLLTHIDLTGMKEITDASIESLAHHCRQLESLNLMWVTGLTDASLIAMGRAQLSRLIWLSIHGNVNVTVKGMEALVKGCQSIETIDVNGCKNIGEYRTRDGLQKALPKFKRMIFL